MSDYMMPRQHLLRESMQQAKERALLRGIQYAFSEAEVQDIRDAAKEHGRSVHGFVHDAVMEALYK